MHLKSATNLVAEIVLFNSGFISFLAIKGQSAPSSVSKCASIYDRLIVSKYFVSIPDVLLTLI